MSMNITEEELQKILKNNPKIKVSQSTSTQTKIPLESPKTIKKKKSDKLLQVTKKSNDTDEEIKTKKKKQPSSLVGKVNLANRTSKYSYTYSNEHIAIFFHDGQLLTVNELFAILQNSLFNVFGYKKTCLTMMKTVLMDIYHDAKSKNKEIPFFTENAEIILFRQGQKLVDEDALATMFKYILDSMKRIENKDSSHYNPYGVIKDDNPKVIHKITTFSEQGKPCFGIQIKKCKDKKIAFNAQDILVYKE